MGRHGALKSRTLASGAERFYLDWGRDGRLWSLYGRPFQDRAEAKLMLDVVQRDMDLEDLPAKTVIARYSRSGLSSIPRLWARFLDSKRRQGLSPRYLAMLTRMGKPEGALAAFWGHQSVHLVTRQALGEWRDDLLSRMAPGTAASYMGHFATFLYWLLDEGILRTVPRRPRISVPERQPRLLSAQDQDRILAEIPEAARGAFLAMAHLGIRPGEARALTAGDYRDDWLTISRAARTSSTRAPVGPTKTKATRRLPVSDELRAWIEQYGPREPGAPLFPPRSHAGLQWAWKQAATRAGIPAHLVGLYENTRHSTATDAIRRGVPSDVVGEFLGHRRYSKTTERYAKLARSAFVHVLGSRKGT